MTASQLGEGRDQGRMVLAGFDGSDGEHVGVPAGKAGSRLRRADGGWHHPVGDGMDTVRLDLEVVERLAGHVLRHARERGHPDARRRRPVAGSSGSDRWPGAGIAMA